MIARVFTALYLLAVLSGHAEAFAIKQPIVVLGRGYATLAECEAVQDAKPVALSQREVCAGVI